MTIDDRALRETGSTTFANAHYNLGVALAGQGQIEAAIASFQRAAEIKPDFLEAHFNLGNVLAGRGQVDAAVAHFQKALRLAAAQNDKRLTKAIQARIKRLQSDAPRPKAQP